MNLTAWAVNNRTVAYFVIVLSTLAGIAAFFQLGQLEDPQFTVKTASVVTPYPGASAAEVELEVTDRIEIALQDMPQLDFVESWSRLGVSIVSVDIKSEYWSDRLPAVWDELRRRIDDVRPSLPPGAGDPVVNNQFGDTFGFLLAITGDGYSYAELEEYVKDLRKELYLVPGVSRVDTWGIQNKAVYIETTEAQMTTLGITDASIVETLRFQNAVVDAGSVDVRESRMRIAPSGEFRSPTDIAELVIRPSLLDTLQNLGPSEGQGASGSELIRIRDIGEVILGYQDPPTQLLRFDGIPALALAMSNQQGINIVDLGKALDQRLSELIPTLPVGVEVHKIHWQGDIVEESVNGFLISLAQAIAIVLVVIAIGMGLRMAVIIGTALILTILGTFVFMAVFGIDLQRMSLGALIIALGMMVDNAIVVADGIAVRIQQGMDRTKAAVEAASQPSMPLLGATVVAVLAFYPIFASTEDAGEYCRTLFTVVAIALTISWVVAMVATPLQCIDLLPAPKGDVDADPYGTKFYRAYRGLLEGCIKVRWLTVGAMYAILVFSAFSFQYVEQLFFPDSSMRKSMVDYWAPNGTRIQQVYADTQPIEDWLQADERVEDVTTFVGQGPIRFYLPVDPELPDQAYAQLIVNVYDQRDIGPLTEDLEAYLDRTQPQALIPIRKYGVGPSNTWKLEYRISGPSVADADILRRLGDEAVAIVDASPYSAQTQIDWRNRQIKVVPDYNNERARWSNVTREDLGSTTKWAFDGKEVGLCRQRDDLIPIVLRQAAADRRNVSGIDVLNIRPQLATRSVPMAQVVSGIDSDWEDPIIYRYDRRRTVTVQSNPILTETFPTLQADILADLEAIEMPPGYTAEWGGEFEDTVDAQASLIPGVIPAVAVMAIILVGLYNAYRPPLVIVFTIPLVLIGIIWGLLMFQAPFGFVALLGAMSLSGMMIKNAVVLLDEARENMARGFDQYESIVRAGLSRLRPVVLAAATTVLGVIPLLQDVFWIGLAIAIMVGLTVGTFLTMFVVPTWYAILYGLKPATSETTPVAEAAAASQT